MGELQTIKQKGADLRKLIEKYAGEIEKLLPAHLTSERFIRCVLNAVATTPKLLDCTKETVILASLEAAALSLEPNVLGQCYLVPYKSKCQLIVGYRGLIQLARRSGTINQWMAGVVREGDSFEYTDFPPSLFHKRRRVDADRGALIAAYSAIKTSAGDWDYKVMYADQVLKRRAVSASAHSDQSPWNTWEEEMWMKTAVLSHAKMQLFSIENQGALSRAVDLDDRATLGESQFSDSKFSDIIDADIEDVPEDGTKKEGGK